MSADQQRNADIRRLAEARATEPGALLPMLHAIQDEIGYVPVYCLGNCALSPAVMVDETVYGRVTPERLDAILA